MVKMCAVSPVFKQFLTIFCCNLLTLSFGASSGWATINFNDLQNENSTFATGPLSLEQASLVTALVNIGGLIGNFVILPISQILGIKSTIHLFGLPLIISSMLIIYATNVYYLYFSRLLSGIVGGALVVGIPTLVTDISFDNVRGALNSLYDPTFNCGLIISFFLGNYLSCLDQAKTQLIAPLIFIIALCFLPESPEHWIRQNKEKKAIKSRMFYQGNEATVENAEFIPKPKIGPMKADDDLNSKLSMRDFLTPQAKKAFFISFVSLTLSFASGTITILSYVTDIFTKTGSTLTPKNSSLLISFTQITANLVLLNIVERINRRTLYIWSSVLTTACFLMFAAYSFLWHGQSEYQWMPPFCFACVVYCSCMGLLPIPYIITIEIFPKKIRQTCLALAVSIMWITLFTLGFIFPILLEWFGLVKCLIALAVMSMLNAIFGIFYLPETRGKSYEEIMAILSK